MATREDIREYPRPPRTESSSEHIIIEFAGEVIADTRRAIRVLETGHPPSYYLPPEDVRVEFLERVPNLSTFCEWKGIANYYSIRVGDRTSDEAGWCYADPAPDYREIRHFISFYPGRVDRITVDGEVVRPEPGDYYGGWITSRIVGTGERR
jgi:uncharacterized protein (DUF427 family)